MVAIPFTYLLYWQFFNDTDYNNIYIPSCYLGKVAVLCRSISSLLKHNVVYHMTFYVSYLLSSAKLGQKVLLLTVKPSARENPPPRTNSTLHGHLEAKVCQSSSVSRSVNMQRYKLIEKPNKH